MSFETTFHNWLNKSLSKSIPRTVKAFNFNLYETGSNFGIELIGASEFDADDSDWACQEVFEANPRSLEIPIEYSGQTWEKCLKKMKALVLIQLNSKSLASQVLNQSKGVGIGFVDGDLQVLTDEKVVFKYFQDYINFAYMKDEVSVCSICSKTGQMFDANMFVGSEDIECICSECLKSGELIKLNICTNDIDSSDLDQSISDLSNEICYQTPALPTWQDMMWPFVDGDYCVFEKLASKLDFVNKEEFINSFSEEDKQNSNLDDLWGDLPDKKITNLKNGNYNMSVYLFTSKGKKICKWDAN